MSTLWLCTPSGVWFIFIHTMSNIFWQYEAAQTREIALASSPSHWQSIKPRPRRYWIPNLLALLNVMLLRVWDHHRRFEWKCMVVKLSKFIILQSEMFSFNLYTLRPCYKDSSLVCTLTHFNTNCCACTHTTTERRLNLLDHQRWIPQLVWPYLPCDLDPPATG